MAFQDKWGFLVDSTALILASTETAVQQQVAQSAPWLLGTLIQTCDAIADDAQIQIVVNALP